MPMWYLRRFRAALLRRLLLCSLVGAHDRAPDSRRVTARGVTTSRKPPALLTVRAAVGRAEARPVFGALEVFCQDSLALRPEGHLQAPALMAALVLRRGINPDVASTVNIAGTERAEVV